MPLLIRQAIVIFYTIGLLQMCPVELAATLVLNKGTPLRQSHTWLFIHRWPQLGLHSKSLSSLSLRTQCASIAHSHRQISNITCYHRNCCARKKFNKQQCVLCEVAILCNQHTSYQSRELQIKSLYLMEAIPKLHPSSLLMDSLGGACRYLIYMLKTKQTPIWVC